MKTRIGLYLSAMLLLCLIAACAPAPTELPSAPTDPPPAETLRTELTLAIGGEREEGYDPTTGWGRYGSPLFQSTLLARDNSLNIVNDLAESYQVSDDGLVWTVKIRPDVKFSDGQPLTAADVVYTFEAAGGSGSVVDLTQLESAAALDDYTVELRLKQPQSTFVNRLITLGIVPQHAHGDDYARNPIGSGPYTLVQWDEGQQLIVEANPHYYGPKPHFQRLVFLFLEEDAAFAAAQAGQAHVVAVPPALGKQAVAGMRVLPVPSVDNRGLMFPMVPNTGAETADGYPIGNDVTADPAIRQAINYVVDRQALVDGVLEGFGAPAYGPVDGLPWWEPTTALEDADAAKAQQILADGGWADADGDGVLDKDGLRAEFSLVYPASDSTRQSLALAVVDMVKPLGVSIQLAGKSWDEIQTMMYSNAVLFGWGSHDQIEMYNLYHSSMAGQGWYNTGFYSNPTVDANLDSALSAVTEADAIPYWKKAQWDGATGFAAQGDAAWAWLVNLDHVYFVSECLDVGQQRVQPHGHGWPITANIVEWTWTCP
jgi:peptide/nickel transport system substrate-binding protein